MALEFTCRCGQRLQARLEHAGKRMRCPSCEQEMTIPNEADAILSAEAAPLTDAVPPGRPARRMREAASEDEERDRPRSAGKTSGKAVAALILGVLAFCLSLFAGGPAVLLGVFSLNDIGRSEGRVTGRGLAITGIILGVVGTVLSIPLILILLLVPAVAKIRDSATRIKSSNNLRQLSLAMMNYADTNQGRLPPAVVYGPNGEPLYSWRVLILPYIEQDNLFHAFHLDEPWDSAHNRSLVSRMPSTFLDPGADPTMPAGSTYYQVFDGPGAAFDSSSRPFQPFRLDPPNQNLNLQSSAFQIRFPSGFQDGTTNTFLIVEAAVPVPWTSPQDLPYDPAKPLPNLFRPSRRGFSAAYADGSVRQVTPATSEQTLRILITPRGGEMMPADAPP